MEQKRVVIFCGEAPRKGDLWSQAKSLGYITAIKRRLELLDPKTHLIIQGGAPGVDAMAQMLGTQMGFEVKEVPAQWQKYGRAAGPKRNIAMLGMRPRLVCAFHMDIARSKGTAHIVREARKRLIEVELFKVKEAIV